MKPPIGGWSVRVRVGGRTHFVNGTPHMIVDKIMSLHKLASLPIEEVRVWDHLNNIWQRREPKRAITITGSLARVPEEPSPTEHIMATPDKYGGALWASLGTFGMKGGFRPDGWAAAVDHVGIVIDPAKSPATGCQECLELWAKIRLDSDPLKVDNEHDAAKWVWNAHNLVNKALGKPQMPFKDAVVLHNWAFRVEGNSVTPA